MDSAGDVVISAETASGKTEAVFLPVASIVGDSMRDSLCVVYVSPLKALINDQNARLGRFFEEMNIEVHSWHGDVSASKKRALARDPRGILQITPESIESLFVNRPAEAAALFGRAQFIVIDEIHAFIGTERGVHLQSLLYRVRKRAPSTLRAIALSATIGSREAVQGFLQPKAIDSVKVVVAPEKEKGTRVCVMHFDPPKAKPGSKQPEARIPATLLDDLELLTRSNKALIFLNSRGDVELAAMGLNQRSRKSTGLDRFLVHHASIAHAERAMAEEQMKEASSAKSVVCTSTLELGIDVGPLDLVVQVNCTFTVGSLKQRLGRSGRREGSDRQLMLYSTDPEQLLQSVAIIDLLVADWVEPTQSLHEPWDVLWHQLVSVAKERGDLTKGSLVREALSSGAFPGISTKDALRLVDDMLEREYLEEMAGNSEIIPGIETERILGNQEWYAVFDSSLEYEVRHGSREIGSLTPHPAYVEGAHFILGGRLWRIKDRDDRRGMFLVEPGGAGARPLFLSTGGSVHQAIRDRMHDLLYSDSIPGYLQGESAPMMGSLRSEERALGLAQNQRALAAAKDGTSARLFAGDDTCVTIRHLLGAIDLGARVEKYGHLTFPGAKPGEVKAGLQQVMSGAVSVAEALSGLDPEGLEPTKFGRYLPEWAQRRHFAARALKIDEARSFLSRIDLRVM